MCREITRPCRLDTPASDLVYYAPKALRKDLRGEKRGARRDKPARNTKGSEAMNGKGRNGGGDEYGVRYTRFVNRTISGWQAAAEAAFLVFVFVLGVAAAACFD